MEKDGGVVSRSNCCCCFSFYRILDGTYRYWGYVVKMNLSRTEIKLIGSFDPFYLFSFTNLPQS